METHNEPLPTAATAPEMAAAAGAAIIQGENLNDDATLRASSSDRPDGVSSLPQNKCSGDDDHSSSKTAKGVGVSGSTTEEEAGAASSSSSSSGGTRGRGITSSSGSGGGSGGPAVVTATTNTTTSANGTSSSGDDRSSSGGCGNGGESGSGSGGGHTTDRGGLHDPSPGGGPSVDNDQDDEVGPLLRHHHRQRRRNAGGSANNNQNRPQHEMVSVPDNVPTSTTTSDECGLPMPVDDRVHRLLRTKDGAHHAAVMAHLPPPKPSTEVGSGALPPLSTSSSSAGDRGLYARDDGGGASAQDAVAHDDPQPVSLATLRPESCSLVAPSAPVEALSSRHPSVSSSKPSKRRSAGKKAEPSTESRNSSSVSEENSRASSRPRSAEQAETKLNDALMAASDKTRKKMMGYRRQLSDAAAPSSSASLASSTQVCGGTSSGSDGGYAASASSNDNCFEQSTCSSPSVSSEEGGCDAEPSKKKKASSSLLVPASHSGNGSAAVGETTRTSSSDLADFSSGVSGAGLEGGRYGAFHLSSRSSLDSSCYSSSSMGDCSSVSDESDGDTNKGAVASGEKKAATRAPGDKPSASSSIPTKKSPSRQAIKSSDGGRSGRTAQKRKRPPSLPRTKDEKDEKKRHSRKGQPNSSSVASTTTSTASKSLHAVKRPHHAISSARGGPQDRTSSKPPSSHDPKRPHHQHDTVHAASRASKDTTASRPPTASASSGGSALRNGVNILERSFQSRIGRATQRRVQQHPHHPRGSNDQEKLAKSFRSALKSREQPHKDSVLAASSSSASASLKTAQPSSSSSALVAPVALKPSAAAKVAPGSTVAPKGFAVHVCERTPIYTISCDIMGQCLSFLEPPEVHSLLTMPLSKEWRSTFTVPQELWRVLCLSEPFQARFEEDAEGGRGEGGGSSDESSDSFPTCTDLQVKHLFGRYRLLYTSFVRCMRYLARIKDDAIHGRAPSAIDDAGGNVGHHAFNANSSLKNFLAKARTIVENNKRRHSRQNGADDASSSPGGGSRDGSRSSSPSMKTEPSGPIGVSDDGSSVESTGEVSSNPKKRRKTEKKVKYGHSKLTERLLGPSNQGEAGPVELPWSCAIYSIVNWMVAFTDVEGIQIMCLRVLPFLLEDENQRTTAQRAGLTDIVLRGMVLFQDSVELHTAAFHTLVLLARPLGGKEGMLFHSAMVNASGIFNIGSSSGKNGIAVMLDSMRRFASDEVLQAMSCWSMVNIALIPSQKTMLVKLGGISVAANAMMQHPFNAEVQFRALFALINLVIPSENLSEGTAEAAAMQEQLGEVNDTSEREMLDENVGQIANLVVVAMKNFCSSEAILNRACLVLHNLSLNEEYHTTLLWTPNCYQMLEWCIGNYRHDHVLQQSAGGTLQRLQMTLAGDGDLRMRFAGTIRAQQQSSLEQARREAIYLQDQEEQEEQQQQNPFGGD